VVPAPLHVSPCVLSHVKVPAHDSPLNIFLAFFIFKINFNLSFQLNQIIKSIKKVEFFRVAKIKTQEIEILTRFLNFPILLNAPFRS